MKFNSDKGFTLIEVTITLAILAVLATIAIPLAQTEVKRVKENDLRRSLREIRSAIDAYKKSVDDGRITRTIDSSGYPKSLDVLVDGVEDARSPIKSKIYFLRRVPPDPMNADSSLEASSTWGKRSYESEASNPQEGEDVYDVYSKSSDIGLNGVAYKSW